MKLRNFIIFALLHYSNKNNHFCVLFTKLFEFKMKSDNKNIHYVEFLIN